MSAGNITSTETHPNAAQIVGVLAEVAHLDDRTLSALAMAAEDNGELARARGRALLPENPLVLEVLSAYEILDELFADDLAGSASYVGLPPEVTTRALGVVRDAVAAAYARPVLDVADHEQLLGAWRRVFPTETRLGPDFGPHHHDVLHVLQLAREMACRHHDDRACALYRSVLSNGLMADPGDHGQAVAAAWQAAVRADRRRLWSLVTRSATESYWRHCRDCPAVPPSDEERLGLRLLLGALYGALTADLTTEPTRAVLAEPLRGVPASLPAEPH